MNRWAGVDVGGPGKGFHVAVVDAIRLVDAAAGIASADRVAAWLGRRRPAIVAVDGPRAWASPGERSRACEREFARARVCAIRYTPARALAEGNEYYDWIRCGLALYDALAGASWLIIECFPTASWTRWGGPRKGETRARWSERVLRGRGLGAVPTRLDQDERDAIGAALTARAWARGEARAFGDLVVPR